MGWFREEARVAYLLAGAAVLAGGVYLLSKRRFGKMEQEANAASGGEASPSAGSLAEKSSYYYAHKSSSSEPKTLVGAQTIYNHKPLGEDEKKALERSSSPPGSGSAWNQAGTWEEKDFSKWAEGRLKELLPAIETAKGLVKFTEVSKVDDCHATVVMSRGKKKAMVEVESVTIKWKNDSGAKGSYTLKEVSSNDIDEMNGKCKVDKAGEGGDEAAVKKDVEESIGSMRKAVEGLVEELRAK